MLSSNAASHQPLPVEQVTQVTEGVACGAAVVVLLQVTIGQTLVAGKSTDENENLLFRCKGKRLWYLSRRSCSRVQLFVGARIDC